MKKVQIGELLPSMVVDNFQKAFEDCVNKNKHRRNPYYIFVHGDWYANYTQMRVEITPMPKRPPMMLNTMCWRINNKTGEIKNLWVLPKDAPIQADFEPAGVDESIIKVAKHLPIIYN